MKQHSKTNSGKVRIFQMFLLFFVAGLSLNTFFYVGYGNLNAYDNASQPSVKAGNEYLVKLSDVDYYFLEHLFNQPSLITKTFEIKGKADTLLSYIAVLGDVCIPFVLIIVLFFLILNPQITLPDALTPVIRKVRLND